MDYTAIRMSLGIIVVRVANNGRALHAARGDNVVVVVQMVANADVIQHFAERPQGGSIGIALSGEAEMRIRSIEIKELP